VIRQKRLKIKKFPASESPVLGFLCVCSRVTFKNLEGGLIMVTALLLSAVTVVAVVTTKLREE
jgi:hypothetical protein